MLGAMIQVWIADPSSRHATPERSTLVEDYWVQTGLAPSSRRGPP